MVFASVLIARLSGFNTLFTDLPDPMELPQTALPFSVHRVENASRSLSAVSQAPEVTVTGGPYFASTYESISIYAPFSQDENENNQASLKWRALGESAWKDGMDLTVDRRLTVGGPNERPIANPFLNQWRGSILGLAPNSVYEIEIAFTDADGVVGTNPLQELVSTRSDSYPSPGNAIYVDPAGDDNQAGSEFAPVRTIQRGVDAAAAGDTVYVKNGIYQESVTVAASGNPNGYITIKNFGSDMPTIDASTNRPACGRGTGADASCAFLITGNHIRISGFEIINAQIGIKLQSPAHTVVLDRNHIHDVRFVRNPSVAILIGHSTKLNDVANITISHNNVTAAPGDPAGHTLHFVGTPGGHVVRHNRIAFTHSGTRGVHGSDCIGGIPNQGIQGLGHDNDIYNNECIGATDDGIELDGSGMNNRLWGNVIYGSNLGISVAPVDIGPSYIFRNVIYDLRIHWTRSCVGVKTGEGGTGSVYFYHNTFYLADPDNLCAFGSNRRATAISSSGGGRDSENLVFKNNIFHGFDRSINRNEAALSTFDFNIHFTERQASSERPNARNAASLPALQAATGQERNGTFGRPLYSDEGGKNFRLRSGSPGVDAGAILVGFNDQDSAWPFHQAAPDIGAFEHYGD